MRDYAIEKEKRIAFIRERLAASGCKGIVYGNSGGKDCALAGILCKLACDDTVGIRMPCESKRNFGEDLAHADLVAQQFGIKTLTFDLTSLKKGLAEILGEDVEVSGAALSNVAPRLRMTVLYTVAQSEGRLVCGTGNRSEIYMGYFTKWGDGASDFNPIADLTVSEVYEFLRFLGAPGEIIEKAPSAGLFEGQTDEGEMGVTYGAIDAYIVSGEANEHDRSIIERYHARSEHKRRMPYTYEG